MRPADRRGTRGNGGRQRCRGVQLLCHEESDYRRRRHDHYAPSSPGTDRCGCLRCTASATTPGIATPTRADWHYDVLAHGFKYNLSDIQAAIGIHQLRKLDQFIERRARYARMYHDAFGDLEEVELPPDNPQLPSRVAPLHSPPQSAQAQDRPREDSSANCSKEASAPACTSSRFRCFAIFRGCRWRSMLVRARSSCIRGLSRCRCIRRMTEEQVQYVARGVREVVESSRRVEISGDRRADRDTPCRRIRRCGLLREALMKNHRNIDVWLERASHLAVVGLSVTAAFLLRFDFTHPDQRSTHPEAIPADRNSGKVADFRLGRILPQSAAIREHSGSVSGLSGECGRLRAVRCDVDVLDRAGNAAVGVDHRRDLLLCGNGAGAVLGTNLQRGVPRTFRAAAHRNSHLRRRRRGRRTGSRDSLQPLHEVRSERLPG